MGRLWGSWLSGAGQVSTAVLQSGQIYGNVTPNVLLLSTRWGSYFNRFGQKVQWLEPCCFSIPGCSSKGPLTGMLITADTGMCIAF